MKPEHRFTRPYAQPSRHRLAPKADFPSQLAPHTCSHHLKQEKKRKKNGRCTHSHKHGTLDRIIILWIDRSCRHSSTLHSGTYPTESAARLHTRTWRLSFAMRLYACRTCMAVITRAQVCIVSGKKKKCSRTAFLERCVIQVALLTFIVQCLHLSKSRMYCAASKDICDRCVIQVAYCPMSAPCQLIELCRVWNIKTTSTVSWSAHFIWSVSVRFFLMSLFVNYYFVNI